MITVLENIQVIRSLLVPDRPRILWVAVTTIAILIWIFFGSRWSGTTITFWNRVVPSYPVGLTESETAAVMAREICSFFALPFFVAFLIRVAAPLSRSFSVSQLLWLRLCPVTPYTLLSARLLAVLEFLLVWLVSCGAILALIAGKHSLAAPDAVVPLLGPCAVFWFCASFIMLLARCAQDGWAGAAVPVAGIIGLSFPLLAFAFRDTVAFNSKGPWLFWFPAYLPFSDAITWGNIGGVAICATVFIFLSLPVNLSNFKRKLERARSTREETQQAAKPTG